MERGASEPDFWRSRESLLKIAKTRANRRQTAVGAVLEAPLAVGAEKSGETEDLELEIDKADCAAAESV